MSEEIERALVQAVIRSILEDVADDETSTRSEGMEARRILDFYRDLSEKHQFQVGDLITWKRGLKNGKYPRQGYPAIVTRIYDTPLIREDMDSGSNHYREPLDMVILVDTGDEVSEFHVDSRRFRPYDGPIEGDEA